MVSVNSEFLFLWCMLILSLYIHINIYKLYGYMYMCMSLCKCLFISSFFCHLYVYNRYWKSKGLLGDIFGSSF